VGRFSFGTFAKQKHGDESIANVDNDNNVMPEAVKYVENIISF